MSERGAKGWSLRFLSDPNVCILNPGKNEVRELPDTTGVTFVPMALVDDTTGTMDVSLEKKLGSVRKGYTYFREGDVVFAKITPCMENGKSAVARGLKKGIGFGSTEFHILRPGRLVTSEWLHCFVRRKDIRELAETSMYGAAGQQRMPIDFLKNLEIPVPSLEEQRRIVARIEMLTSRAEEVRHLQMDIGTDILFALDAVYQELLQGVQWQPLGKIASLVRRKVDTIPDEEYEEMGIRSFGKGTFKKPVLTGHQIGNKRIFRIHEGDLVFNNVFAWEGAIAVAQPEDNGRVGSHRFITYVCHEGKAVPEFLCHHFLSEKGIEDIRAASPGSAGRNRTLGLKKLEQIMVPIPDFEEQRQFQELVKRRREISLLSRDTPALLREYQSALLSKAFLGEL